MLCRKYTGYGEAIIIVCGKSTGYDDAMLYVESVQDMVMPCYM